jgi:hypothetical protein
MTNDNASDFEAYSVGICQASVCTSLSLRQAMKRLNAEHPTGIRSKWRISSDATFATGQKNGCPCDAHPATHRHYLFTC